MDVRVRVFVEGRVQGVFFRASCASEARDAGVRGWVRNTAEGNVEAVFEGARESVDRLIAWCRHGPVYADVVSVTVTPEETAGEQAFSIR